MYRILVADDHGLYRKGLKNALESAFAGARILEADSFEATLVEIESKSCLDLVLLDLNMRGRVSFQRLRMARQSHPETRFLVISASDARSDILNSLAAGAHGFVSKLQPEHEIVGAVGQVLSGCVYVPPWLAEVTGSAYIRVDGAPASPGQDYAETFGRFTPRQKDVLPLLAKGLSNKQIARALNISEATTKIHVAGLCRVLGVRNRTEAAWATRTLVDEN